MDKRAVEQKVSQLLEDMNASLQEDVFPATL